MCPSLHLLRLAPFENKPPRHEDTKENLENFVTWCLCVKNFHPRRCGLPHGDSSSSVNVGMGSEVTSGSGLSGIGKVLSVLCIVSPEFSHYCLQLIVQLSGFEAISSVTNLKEEGRRFNSVLTGEDNDK